MKKARLSIWFIIGVQFLVMGVIIVAAGLGAWIWPPAQPVRYEYFHPELVEGLVMLALGTVYVAKFRPQSGATD